MTMKFLRYYSIFLSLFIASGTIILGLKSGQMLFSAIFFPVIIYFIFTIFKIRKVRKLLTYYSFILVTIMAVTGFVGTSSIPQLISAILFCPMAIYFWALVLPKKNKKLLIPAINLANQTERITEGKVEKLEEEVVLSKKFGKGFDVDRRMFLKLIGSTGLMVFIFSIFSQKAEGAFFGSVPGPGTVALKDTTGVQVDPAIKTPTDGYKIARVDDSVPAYYGFIRKDGAWFIMREESDGTYKYAKGASNFSSTGWNNRGTSLSYNDFDVVFG
jgi:hypothetical protein